MLEDFEVGGIVGKGELSFVGGNTLLSGATHFLYIQPHNPVKLRRVYIRADQYIPVPVYLPSALLPTPHA